MVVQRKSERKEIMMSIEELLVAGAWRTIVGRLSRIFESADEETLQRQIAPGRNRAVYLLGHLIVAHDRMFTLMNLGLRLYPQLDDAYFDNPDRSRPDPVAPAELKAAWTDVSSRLTSAFELLTAAQWLEKHSAVSPDDFAKDPTRNRLAILLSRTNHAAFHTGQIILTK
jgi:hypothetical protein